MFKLISKVISRVLVVIILIYMSLMGFVYYTDQQELRLVTDLKSVYTRLDTPQEISMLTHGAQSLKHRLKLIREAEQSLELEFFIYNLDKASKVLTYELIQAAARVS